MAQCTSFILFWILFNVTLLVAINDVISIEIGTAPQDDAGYPITVTLWFNFTIYRYILLANIPNHIFSNTEFDILGSSSCHKAHYNNIPEAKIMIENNHPDAIEINTVAVHTTAAWFGISGRCVEDTLIATQDWLLHSSYAEYVMNEASCSSGKSNILMCVDNQVSDCLPAKQIFYFDTLRANEFINNAIWSDATGVEPEIVTCDPTKNPTDIPISNTITSHSTAFPSYQSYDSYPPTLNSTPSPSYYPTVVPSKTTTVTTLNTVTLITTVISSANNHTVISNTYDSTQSQLGAFLAKWYDSIIIALCGLITIVCMSIFVLILCLKRRKKQSKEYIHPQKMVQVANNELEVEANVQLQMSKKCATKLQNEAQFIVNPEGITDGIRPDEFIVKGEEDRQTDDETSCIIHQKIR